MGIQLSQDFLDQIGMTPNELLIELAVHLYSIDKLSMGQARNFAQLDQFRFQEEMEKRDVYMNYSIEDFDEDLKTIEELEQLD